MFWNNDIQKHYTSEVILFNTKIIKYIESDTVAIFTMSKSVDFSYL